MVEIASMEDPPEIIEMKSSTEVRAMMERSDGRAAFATLYPADSAGVAARLR